MFWCMFVRAVRVAVWSAVEIRSTTPGCATQAFWNTVSLSFQAALPRKNWPSWRVLQKPGVVTPSLSMRPRRSGSQASQAPHLCPRSLGLTHETPQDGQIREDSCDQN
jgi:hypothetical protein